MFCPECGTKIPLTEEIHGGCPIYQCPKCETWWVYDPHNGAYEAYGTLESILNAFGLTEADIVKVAAPTVQAYRC